MAGYGNRGPGRRRRDGSSRGGDRNGRAGFPFGALPPVNGRAVLTKLFGDRAIPLSANPGLVFDRYMRLWQEAPVPLDRAKEIRPSLSAFVEDYARLESGRWHADLLAAVHTRLERVAKGRTFRTSWRLVTGLGTNHPMENGFTFDGNVGVPYLPGSTVKGLALACARVLGVPQAQVVALFGLQRDEERSDEDESAAGDLVFLPAYPARWPKLEVDVVNTHHPGYYANRPGDRPARAAVDYENPNPVFFLTVAPNQPFVFRMLSRSGHAAHVDEGFRVLKDGLRMLGIGGKTAVGYGRLDPIE